MDPSAGHIKTVVLTVSLILSLALYFALYFLFINRDVVINGASLGVSFALTFHAIPALFLQWLLCRMEKPVWARWLPLALLAAVAVIGVLYLTGTLGSGWDVLGGAMILCWCIAPAAGLALGWMASGRKLAAIGLFLMLAVYVVLKAHGGPLWLLEPVDLAALAVLAAGLYFLFRK